MKDWISYLRTCIATDVWGLVLVDYYYKSKREAPLDFLRRVIPEIAQDIPDIVGFHRVLVCVCVQLAGRDFPAIFDLSLMVLRPMREKIPTEALISIIGHYSDYRQDKPFAARIEMDGFPITPLPSSSNVSQQGSDNRQSGEQNTVHVETRDSEDVVDTGSRQGGHMKAEPLQLFLSYSQKDKKYVEELRKSLKPSERNGAIQPWYDGEITPGEEWKALIEKRLREADIIVCQLSRDFLNSEFCVLKELETAIARREAGKAGLVAYVLHDCDWKETKLAKFQILPRGAKPIDEWANRHKFWIEIADGIKEAVNKLRQQRSMRPAEPVTGSSR